MKRTLQLLLILSICVCFVIFLKGTDIGEAILLIKQLGFYCIFILITTFLAYLAGTWGWKYCIDSPVELSILQLFTIRHVGNTITLFNPASAIAGEFFNAKMLISNGVKDTSAYQAVLLGRILMILSQLTLLVLLLIWFILFLSEKLPPDVIHLIYLCFVIVLLIIPVLLYLLLKEGKERKNPVKERKWGKIIHRIVEVRSLLAEYIRRRPKETATAFLLYTIQWILNSLELFFILYFLNYDVNIWNGLFLDTLIIVLKSTASFIPGQLGVEELINKFVLHLIGIPSPNLWLSVSILRRTRQLFWSGIAVLFYIQKKKKETDKKSWKYYL